MNDAKETAVEQELLPKKPKNLKKELLGWIEAIVSAVIVVGLLVTFVGRPILVSGHSMENTLMNDERILITPLYTELKYNDIVVVRQADDVPLVKRVIAKAGDVLDISWATGEVYRNGEVLDEPFIREQMRIPVYASQMIEFPVLVPEGHIFVMGDNRNNSSDSRLETIGMIDTQNVMGKAIFRIWPLDKFGPLEDYTY